MPKVKKHTGGRKAIEKLRSQSKRSLPPLANDLIAAKQAGEGTLKEFTPANDDDGQTPFIDAKEEVLPSALSQRIIQTAQEQQHELAKESKAPKHSRTSSRLFKLKDDEDDEGEVLELLEDEMKGAAEFEDIEVSPEDERVLSMFMPNAAPTRKTLADIILDKIKEKEHMAEQDADAALKQQLDPKIVNVFTEVGRYLALYRSGKIPKAFKIIPALKNWEDVLYLTNPQGWSPQATYVATKLFASNLNPKMAQRFYNLVILPKIQENIDKYKKLNYHLYQSLKKALYKPSAFFRGILLPMAEEGCNAREAVIMASVLQKCTIPVLHSSVALLKISELPYSGVNALFMKTLLDKQYALPYKVVDRMISFFAQFIEDERRMPVIWHQLLLTLVQKYKATFKPDQIKQIKEVVRKQNHHLLTPAIRRELFALTTGTKNQKAVPMSS